MTENHTPHFTHVADAFIQHPKPEWCRASDVVLILYMLTIADEHGVCSPKQTEMAQCVALGDGMIALRNSINRLRNHEWITQSLDHEIGKRKVYTINFNNIPPYTPARREATNE